MREPDARAHQPPPVLTEQDLQRLGHRIAQRRRSKGWKQKHLALQASIEPGRLSRLERGKAMPKLQELIHLRQVLGGTIDELIFEPPLIVNERLSQFLREVEHLATEEERETLAGLLQALAIGLRAAACNVRESAC